MILFIKFINGKINAINPLMWIAVIIFICMWRKQSNMNITYFVSTGTDEAVNGIVKISDKYLNTYSKFLLNFIWVYLLYLWII